MRITEDILSIALIGGARISAITAWPISSVNREGH
jgi:hypothetical protein